MNSIPQWAGKIMLLGLLAFPASGVNASPIWEGEFHALDAGWGTGTTWAFTIKCKTIATCQISSRLMKEGKYLPPENVLTNNQPMPLLSDPKSTNRLRWTIRLMDKESEPSNGDSYYKSAIYHQIGLLDRIIECRSATELPVKICLLDRALIDVGGGKRSEWLLLEADMSSAGGCPGPGCPALLTKR